MLQKLNERVQGVIAWVVVVLIGVTFTLFGVDYYAQSRQTTNAKAVVNDAPITAQAFEIDYRRARGRQDNSNMTAEREKKLQNQVLEQIIMNEVMVQAAQKNGFDVSSGQADAAILNIPQFQEDGHFSAEKYHQVLSAALFTSVSFQNEVKQGMLLNQQRFAFIGSSFALPGEIERFVRLYMQTRDYDYLIIPASYFEKDIQVSEGAISEYYKKHKKQFMSPEQVSLEYVTLSMKSIKDNLKISQEDVAQYYAENQNNYLTPTRWHVAHILFALPEEASQAEAQEVQKKAEQAYEQLKKNPEQFEHLVSTRSDDKLSIADKGSLPWITAGQSDYDKALSILTKPGQISAPHRTRHGYEIFKLLAHKPAAIKPLTEVAETIKEQLTIETAQTHYAHALEQLSDLSYQSPDSLQPVADSLKLDIKTTDPFSRHGNEEPITKNQLVINAAFSQDVMELGNNSEPIQIDNDSVMVLRVKEHIAKKQQSLMAVRAQIKKILIQQLAQAKAKERGISLSNAVGEKNQQQLINNHQLLWQSIKQSSRDNDEVEPLINDLAFNILRPERKSGLLLPNGDYVVVKLKHIHDGRLVTLDKEQQHNLIQQIEASYGMMDYDLYAKSLMNQAVIVRH